MLYFKNIEIADKYHISLGTVRNWIEASEKGKLNLTLHKKGNRLFIANTSSNTELMSELTQRRKKFRNNKAVKRIKPLNEFYDLFNEKQILEIASGIEAHHEIPHQYNYFNGGADMWDIFTKRMASETSENSFQSVQYLLDISSSSFDAMIQNYKRVNIIDVGCGNAMPARKILEQLIKKNKLGRYIAYDISPTMIEIAKANINSWFGDSVKFEACARDMNHDRFHDLLISEYVREDYDETLNVVLLLGGTVRNMQHPENVYRTIYDSMGKNDIFIEDVKLDSEATRKYFDYDVDATGLSNSLVVSLLNLNPSYYDVELGFDEQAKQRYERIRLKVALEIELNFKKGSHIISLNKGDAVLTWHVLHVKPNDVFVNKDTLGFNVIYSGLTDNRHHMLTMSRIKLPEENL